jgi:2-polyprenyl-6-methoxyphenol hydroxylase-like FAD-dependent oxidoreductase
LTCGKLALQPFLIGDTTQTTLSPTRGAVCSQDVLERVLLQEAQRLPLLRIQFEREVIHLAQDAEGVRLTVRDRRTGDLALVDATWVVAADGARSPTRAMLGVPLDGMLEMTENINVLFKANLEGHLAPLNCVFVSVTNPLTGGIGVIAGIPTARDANEWTYNFQYFPEKGQRPDDFDEAACVKIVRAVTGIPDLAVEILGVSEWTATGAVAQAMRCGRILLAGDAAHLMPPAGGQGMNTGILDAHNLAWRLAAVLQGWGGEPLLDDYCVERRAAARHVVDAAVANMDLATNDPQAFRELWSGPQYGLILGVAHLSDSVLSDGSAPPAQTYPFRTYVPHASPGFRAPHVWADPAARLSSLDFLGWKMTVVCASAPEAWRAAAHEAQRLGVPVQVVAIDEAAVTPTARSRWKALYGLGTDGALLVRPDGIVAWRAPQAPACATTALLDALARVLRPPQPGHARRGRKSATKAA